MVILFKYSNNVVGFRVKLSVFYSELSFLIKRTILKIILGRKKRDKWFLDHKIGRLSKVNKKQILIKNEQGLKYWICPTDWDFFVVSTKCESLVIDAFVPKEGDVVIDVGANIGKYSIYTGKLVGKSGKVYAFEPSQHPFELLSKSIIENKLENTVTLIHSALSDTKGKCKLYQSKDVPIASLMFKLSDSFTEVDTTTIDDFVAEQKIKKIDWIKIDVEGAEYEVLSGAINTLKNNNIKLIFEVLTVNKDKVLLFIESIGYTISMLDTYHTEEFTNQGFSNFLAIKHTD